MGIKPSDSFRAAFSELQKTIGSIPGVVIYGREKSRYSEKQKLDNLQFKGECPEVLDKIAFTIVVKNSSNPSELIKSIFNKLKNSKSFAPLRKSTVFSEYQEHNQNRIRKYPNNYTPDNWLYRVHDYITYPKKNGYSSFHCGFMFNGIPIEIHIETRENYMNNNFGDGPNHDKIYKARPQVNDTELKELVLLLELLEDPKILASKFNSLRSRNSSLLNKKNILPTTLNGNFSASEEGLVPKLSRLLLEYNIKIDDIISPDDGSISEENFIGLQKIFNRYYLHELIVLYANGFTDNAGINFAYNNLIFESKRLNFPLEKSIYNYCNYLGISTRGKSTKQLVKECILGTNSVLYQYDDDKIVPINKHEIKRKIEGYEDSAKACTNRRHNQYNKNT